MVAPRKLKASLKKPNWINDLQKQPSFLDLVCAWVNLHVITFFINKSAKSLHICLKDSIILALNCSNAARLPVTQECSTSSSGDYFAFASV